MFGNMNRASPSSHIRWVTTSDEKPIASEEPKAKPARPLIVAMNPRRVCGSPDAAAAGRTCAGLAGIGGTSIFFLATAGASVGAALAAAADLVTGPGLAALRAAARMLAVSFAAAGPAGLASVLAGVGFAAAAGAGLGTAGSLAGFGAAAGAA